jgi:membrane associated rhomboid family serine protease
MLNSVKVFSVTNIIIFVTVIVYILQHLIPNGSILLGLNIYFLKYEFYWQPLTAIFTHGGIMHILMNMFILFQFGNLIEQIFGIKKFLFIYLIGGILTSLFSFYFIVKMGMMVNLVGASGAICVILGFIALKDTYQRSGMIVWVLLMSFLPLLLGMPIAWYAHLIGFAFGWMIGYFI